MQHDADHQHDAADFESWSLSSHDQAAVDAWLTSREEESQPASFADTRRLERVDALLGLLAAPEMQAESTLVDVTLLRMARQVEAEPALSSFDADALDAWALAEYEADSTPSALRGRAARHHELASAVRDSDITATPLLVERTFQAVAARVAADRASGLTLRTTRSWRLADALSIAAMLLIGVSVLWPALNFVGDQRQLAACRSNLGGVASAMGLYAGDHRDQFPVATAGIGGGSSTPWWNVSPQKPQANSANLYTLARTRYAKLSDLACAGNPDADRGDVKAETYDWTDLNAISFSYQIMGSNRPNWQRVECEPAKVVVLSDRSPVVRRAVRHQPIDPLENSSNHGGRGQYVLHADGTVAWMSTPERACGDNIWLPRALEIMLKQVAHIERTGKLEGFEMPDDAMDSFVGP